MIVFLDTNVLVSAAIGRGVCRDVVRIVQRSHELVTSEIVVAELETVLRDKFGLSEKAVYRSKLSLERAIALKIPGVDRSSPEPLENDALILESISRADVDLLVTGDLEMRDRAQDLGIQAVSPRGFLELVSGTNDDYPSLIDDNGENVVSEPKHNPIKDKSFVFAIDIVDLYKKLQDQREYVLSKQILKSGTSIGANIEEATAAESHPDFIHRMKIAMKEARETHYWLRLLDQSDLVEDVDFKELLNQADELSRMLTSITKTATENLSQKRNYYRR